MSRKMHYVICEGREMNLSQLIHMQYLLQEVHGFAKLHYEQNKCAKYMTVNMRFFADSRDSTVYNPLFELTGEAGSISKQKFICASPSTKPDDFWCRQSNLIAQIEQDGETYEIVKKDMVDAILDWFPDHEMKESYRYCSAFLARWAEFICGEATGRKEVTDYTKQYLSKYFPHASTDSEMYVVIGKRKARDVARTIGRMPKVKPEHVPTEEDLDCIQYLVTGNKDEDGYMIAEIFSREERLFKGKIKTEYHFGLILDSLGIQYDW